MPSPFHVGAHTASTLAHRSAHYLRLSLRTPNIPLDVTLGGHKGDLQPYVAHTLHTPMAPVPWHCPVPLVCASPWAGSTWVGTAQGGRHTHLHHTHPHNPGDWLLPTPLHTPSTNPWHLCLATALCPLCVLAHGQAAHGWELHKVRGTHTPYTHPHPR